MYESIALLLEALVYTWPSKRNRELWRKIKHLKKQSWYRKLQDQHLKGFHLNDSVRDYIEKSDVQRMVEDPHLIEDFTKGLKEILAKENF